MNFHRLNVKGGDKFDEETETETHEEIERMPSLKVAAETCYS